MSKSQQPRLVHSQDNLTGAAFDGAVLTILQAHGTMTARTIGERMGEGTSRVAWALYRLVFAKNALKTWTDNHRECVYTPRVRKRSVRLVGVRRRATR